MMLINVKSEINSLKKHFTGLKEAIKNTIIKQSVHQIGDKAYTETIKSMSKFTGIPQKNLRHGSDSSTSRPIMKKTKGNAWIEINAKSRWLHVTEDYFAYKQTKNGVTSKIYNVRQLHKGSFLGKGKDSKKIIAFIRTKQMKTIQGIRKKIKRAIIKPVWAFNPANEMMKSRIADDIAKKYTPLIIKRCKDKLTQYLNKPLGKSKK